MGSVKGFGKVPPPVKVAGAKKVAVGKVAKPGKVPGNIKGLGK